MAQNKQLTIGLAGEKLVVDTICFHNSRAVSTWQADYSEAQLLLSDFSTGLGSLGSLGFVLISSAAIGLLEGLATKVSQKKGLKKLSQALADYRKLASRGVFVPVSDVENIEVPDPTQWTAFGEVTTEANLRGLEHEQLVQLIEEVGITQAEIDKGFALRQMARPLSILPGEFLHIQSSERKLFVRWSEVSSYELK